ncbi:MAG TPA: leucine-rich repeat domain-containing protein, partial [candidate division Zixibacteria bacterium]|nr:leucine-rich repeat domain-containing protein [candidate division Zixibacteria bacterium]
VGSTETYTVDNLTTDMTYYFALKTADSDTNWSDLSNVASGTTNDVTPPAAVSDLVVTNATGSHIRLTWTAPGDDGNTGTAGIYDIRYDVSPIDAGSWEAATVIALPPTPQAAGNSEEVWVENLATGVTYYFALKTADSDSNWSDLSNIASGKIADVTPPDAVLDLIVIDSQATALTLQWTAPGDDWDSGTAAFYDIRISTSYISTVNWDAATPVASPPAPQTAGMTETFTVTGLETGAIYYFALKTADSDSNWSEISNIPDGMAITNEVVVIPDANLEAVLRADIGKPTGDLMVLDLALLDKLNGRNANITDLTGLEHCHSAYYLELDYNNVSDLTPVGNLRNLLYLDIGKNQLTDLSPLTNLPKISRIDIWGNSVSDLSPVANFTTLSQLYVNNCPITDLSPVAALVNLSALTADETGVTDYSPLAGLSNLILVAASHNGLTDISDFAALTALRTLYLNNNQITDISALAGLTSLRSLHIYANNISNL